MREHEGAKNNAAKPPEDLIFEPRSYYSMPGLNQIVRTMMYRDLRGSNVGYIQERDFPLNKSTHGLAAKAIKEGDSRPLTL